MLDPVQFVSKLVILGYLTRTDLTFPVSRSSHVLGHKVFPSWDFWRTHDLTSRLSGGLLFPEESRHRPRSLTAQQEGAEQR